jgi:glyoxylase-like metal-dependent hydrolase (beta-lactamase superfamily II)
MAPGIEVVPLQLGHVTPLFGSLSGRRTIIQAFLIRHPDGPVLVDTGVGTGHQGVDKLYSQELVPLAGALSEAGCALTSVVAVINTHLHFDHCGQNSLFAGVPIYVQAQEYQVAAGFAYTVPEWVWFAGARYEQKHGAAEVVRGVSLVPTPGHTPGHQSVRVETDSGLAIIAGHAAHTAAEFAGLGSAPGGDWDDAAYQRSLAFVRSLGAQRVHFSHDARIWSSTSSARAPT